MQVSIHVPYALGKGPFAKLGAAGPESESESDGRWWARLFDWRERGALARAGKKAV